MNTLIEEVARRDFLSLFGRVALTVGSSTGILTSSVRFAKAQQLPSDETAAKEKWLDELFQKRLLGGVLHLSRFVERIYFLTKSIGWSPNPGEPYQRIDVPSGFVTDFASVPRLFWSALPPDGEYAYAAIIHDYLYWTQTRSRSEADDILKFAMQDLKVSRITIETIYVAVRAAGGFAWDENARLKQSGEKRVLKKEPDAPATRWDDWKKRPDVFAD